MNTTLAQQIANEGGVEAWMVAQQHKSLLRFLTCGSVDDGKSTLIGRLLHDTRQIYEDQLSSLHNDSKRHGTQGEKLDLAHYMQIDFLTAYLATSPGGVDSVAVIAAGSHADMALIMAMQTLRLFSILLTGPAVARFISVHAPKRPA